MLVFFLQGDRRHHSKIKIIRNEFKKIKFVGVCLILHRKWRIGCFYFETFCMPIVNKKYTFRLKPQIPKRMNTHNLFFLSSLL